MCAGGRVSRSLSESFVRQKLQKMQEINTKHQKDQKLEIMIPRNRVGDPGPESRIKAIPLLSGCWIPDKDLGSVLSSLSFLLSRILFFATTLFNN